MHVISARNVNDAYAQGVRHLREWGEPAVSASVTSGPMRVSPSPVITVYERPTERVLFDARRDANPFFHLFESLWMIGGRNDAAWLDQFVRNFGERFAEPDGRIHGAYGHRWVHHFTRNMRIGHKDGVIEATWESVNQLDVCVELLRANPGDRQAVIQMWDSETDLGVPGLRDRPCNTQVYLRVRRDTTVRGGELTYDDVLDITVTCRSNDIVYGAYGANAVHFSVLQEYLAARIGVGVGTMYQFSNNWHGYTEVLDRVAPADYVLTGRSVYNFTGLKSIETLPMFTVPDQIDGDVELFLSDDWLAPDRHYYNDWFSSTAVPMRRAHQEWRGGRPARALAILADVAAEDWRLAATEWIERRMDK